MSETGIITIRGKDYHTVAKRVADFRRDHPDFTIATSVLSTDKMVRVQAKICDNQTRTLATGHAEENREVGINRTSALENAETSAVGRALAMYGYGGTEIASADEMSNALEAQDLTEATDVLLRHNHTVRECLQTIVVVKGALDRNDYSTAKEAWNELSEDEQRALWVAPSKGGIFETAERNAMKSEDWKNAD